MDSLRFTGLVLSVCGLFTVRFFESELFYDPLIEFFKGPYQTESLPQINWRAWSFNLIGRYLLNAVLSLFSLKMIYGQKSILQFSAVLYFIILLILLPLLWGLMYYYVPGDYRGLFYVRRFLIHPVLLLLLIPSFYMLKPKKNI